ncbi:late cornified envelope protein 1A-like [Eschrichtius robustus]|uniref:late cornified envelope protein 1A-like n=1 Tax=Eschrichtius robustus TaxID=9764 RepID=UPI0035C22059
MSCQQNQQQCQCLPKCPSPQCPPKCPPKCPPASSCCGPSCGHCCSSGAGGCCLSRHRSRRSHRCRYHSPDCCSEASGGSGCCRGGEWSVLWRLLLTGTLSQEELTWGQQMANTSSSSSCSSWAYLRGPREVSELWAGVSLCPGIQKPESTPENLSAEL